ncbi:MAG: AAA family ATPase [Lachnospiraceae bacterium]|nr:AAA family ATPase [Lachnospiraceae bacterium]
MDTTKKLPIGIEGFEEIRTEGFYYVDKTDMIRELLNNWAKVNLFTRPRRFGKSLNMDMLKYFFEYGADPKLFEGLKIEGERELCEQYMGRFPVISVTLKGAAAGNYGEALAMLRSIIGDEAMRFEFLLESGRLTDAEKERYRQLIQIDPEGKQEFAMSLEMLGGSIQLLSQLLCKHYGQKVILLIDEYDVPLDRAQRAGYYEEMAELLRNLFGQALKTNPNLYFAVMTGCLRIAKESIFTGLNNLNVFSVIDVSYAGYFGFSDEEVRDMLAYYGLSEKYKVVREWYDGYRFGNGSVYCPWDVISYVKLLRSDPEAEPRAFWANTSGNEIVRTFLERAGASTRREMEILIDGGTVGKKLNHELTYRELYQNIDNLWSVLFTTGYLTWQGKPDGDVYELKIPNLELKKIYIDQIMEWFKAEAGKDAPKLDALCLAFAAGDAGEAERQFTAYLKKTISIRDTSVRKGKKENFYHGILLGLLSHREDWVIRSNQESGEGFSDILVEIEEENKGIVIEVKYPDGGELDAGCLEALAQIEEKGYEGKLREDGMETVIKYGISCRRKSCRVMAGKEEGGGDVCSDHLF